MLVCLVELLFMDVVVQTDFKALVVTLTLCSDRFVSWLLCRYQVIL